MLMKPRKHLCLLDFQAIIPNTLTDELSYYEELRHLIKVVNRIIDCQRITAEEINEINKEIARLKELIENLDVEKIYELLASYTLYALFNDNVDLKPYAHIKLNNLSAQSFDIYKYNGVVIAACAFEGGVSLYNLTSGQLIRTLTSANLTHCNDLTFYNDSIYIVNGGENKIVKIDLLNYSETVITLADSMQIHGIAYSEKRDKFFVLDTNGQPRILEYDSELNTELNDFNVDYGTGTTDKQGIYAIDDYVMLIGGTHTRQPDVFNFINIYDTLSEAFIKKIYIPYNMELEGLAIYEGQTYFYYNCFSRSGVICLGNLYQDFNHYAIKPEQNWGFGRFNNSWDIFINENATTFFLDNTASNPFYSWFEANSFIMNKSMPYYHLQLLSDIEEDLVVNANNYKSLGIYGNGAKRTINGNIDFRSMTYIHFVDCDLNGDSMTIQKCDSIRLDNTNISKVVSLNGVNNVRITGTFTAIDGSFDSDRILGTLRIDALPTNLTHWKPVNTACDALVLTTKELCNGIETTIPTPNHAYVALENGDTISDLWAAGYYYLATDVAITDRPDMRGSTLKLETFRGTRRFEYRNIKNTAIYERTIDQTFDSGWIKKDIVDDADIYVNSSTGNDNNSGSSAFPLKTIAEALKRFKSEKYLRIRLTGTFNENVSVVDRDILLMGSSASHAVINGTVIGQTCFLGMQYVDVNNASGDCIRNSYFCNLFVNGCILTGNVGLSSGYYSKNYIVNTIVNAIVTGILTNNASETKVQNSNITGGTFSLNTRGMGNTDYYNTTLTGATNTDSGGILTSRS